MPLKAGRWRSGRDAELRSMVERVASNAELMARYRAAVGGGNPRAVGRVIDDIAEYINSLDDSFGLIEATTIAVILNRNGKTNEPHDA
jgi:hypothetical protein